MLATLISFNNWNFALTKAPNMRFHHFLVKATFEHQNVVQAKNKNFNSVFSKKDIISRKKYDILFSNDKKKIDKYFYNNKKI